MYVDTDFLVALIKPGDWLREPALKLLNDHEGDLWTSPATAIQGILGRGNLVQA